MPYEIRSNQFAKQLFRCCRQYMFVFTVKPKREPADLCKSRTGLRLLWKARRAVCRGDMSSSPDLTKLLLA